MKSRARIAIPIVVVIALVAFRVAQNRAAVRAQIAQRAAAAKAPVAVKVAEARVGDLVATFEGVASVDPPLNVKLAAQISGVITFLEVHEGDGVSTGQVLVRIDPAEVEAQVRQAQGAVNEAQWRLSEAQTTRLPTDVSADTQLRQQEYTLATARANLRNAQAHYGRQQELYEQGFIAAQDVEDAMTAAEVQQASLNEARAALEFARANLAQKPAYEENLAALRAAVAQAQQNLRAAVARRSYTTLVAPLEGFVTGRFMDPGSMATPGQPILSLQYMQDVWVTMPVPADVAENVTVGHPAQVRFDALPDRKLTGSIIQFNPSADPQSRQFSVRIGLANPGMAIKPGMFAHVVFETGRLRGATLIPREALLSDEKGSYVMVAADSRIARRRAVRVGKQGVAEIAIAEGLRAGEQVVTLSAQPLKDGQSVSISSGPAASTSSGATKAY